MQTRTDLNKWLEQTANIRDVGFCEIQDIRKRIVCKDGTKLSVQASETHYCQPRVNQNKLQGMKYYQVEVWRVSCEVPNEWLQYGDPEENPFAYIPIEMVEDFIDSHGGMWYFD